MQIRLFDNYVKKQIELKTTYIKGAINVRNKRINLLTSFIIFLRYKLIYDDLYLSSQLYNSYYRMFSFSRFLKMKKPVYLSSLFILHRNHIIKRFFFSVSKKKLFEFLYRRLTLEKTNEIKRLSRKPITLLQKEKYNLRRRMKRLERLSVIDLAEQR